MPVLYASIYTRVLQFNYFSVILGISPTLRPELLPRLAGFEPSVQTDGVCHGRSGQRQGEMGKREWGNGKFYNGRRVEIIKEIHVPIAVQEKDYSHIIHISHTPRLTVQ